MSKKETDKTEDDFSLFRQEVGDASPLSTDTFVHHKQPPKNPSIQHRTREILQTESNYSDMLPANLVGNEEYLSYQGPGIQHRVFAKLRAGKIHIEAELDLHGFTLAHAEPALSEFINYCQQQHIQYIRLVHGKGWSSKENKPVLKSHINQWLRQNSKVLAFCSATVPDGGTGALYVLLKRTNTE